ncbi:MAG: TIGR00375 family protein [Methanobrevibacter sp.]|nr:TIGR00375 family protein [Methanobrevibacter sp.]
MLINADLHIHSRFSMASSKDMTINNIAPQAKLKGLQLMGTGDGFHPKWLNIIEESTTYSGDGIYSNKDCDFILTAEVEAKNKIHHLFIIPNIEIAKEMSEKLSSKNKDVDGRPRVDMNGSEIKDLARDYECLFGPAHAFTPWTGMYKTYNSVYDCYGGKPDFLELGLSADSDMADRVKELQDIPFLTNSDAHSPWPHRLGREFNQIEMDDVSFTSIRKGIKNNEIKANYGLIADLGKYHMTACSKCYQIVDPLFAKKNKMKCDDCGGIIKKGVDFRISEIADWNKPKHPNYRPPYIHLMPLSEIISMKYNKGVTTKTVQNIWKNLIKEFNNEIDILINIPLPEIDMVDKEIAIAINAFRDKSIHITPGGGGKYGEISLNNDPKKDFKVEKRKQMTLDNFKN